MGARVPRPRKVGLMPTYTYECRAEDCTCKGEIVEQLFSPLDAPPPICPNCKEPMTKIVGPVEVRFKGPGFYCTDTRQSW